MDPFMLIAIALPLAFLAAGGAVRSRPSEPSGPDPQEVMGTIQRHTGMLMARSDRLQMEIERLKSGNERLKAGNARLAAENDATFARLMARLRARAESDYPDW